LAAKKEENYDLYAMGESYVPTQALPGGKCPMQPIGIGTIFLEGHGGLAKTCLILNHP
jgi:hypothetical protein